MRQKIKVEKKRCSTCPAKNRRVRQVAFFGRVVNLCEECATIAARLAKKEDEKNSQKPDEFTVPFVKQSQIVDSVRDIVRATKPTIPLRTLTRQQNA